MHFQGQIEGGRVSRSNLGSSNEVKENGGRSVSTRSENKDAEIAKEKIEIPPKIRRRVEQEYVKIRNAHKEKRTQQIIVSTLSSSL